MAYLPTSNRREAAQTTASSSSDGASKVPGFTKEIIDLVKQNGLDSDVVTFLRQVERTLDLANDPSGENLSMREILKVQRLASQVATNYKDYEKARASLDEQDAWGEMATDKRGYLYVQNQETGKIETISQSSYKEDNNDKYIALTNEDVLNIRRADPSLAYRMDILDNVSSAVGMKTITDYARTLINEFGKTSITGYSEKQAEKIRSGLEHIVSGDAGNFRGILTGGPDGVYKISSESTIADTGIEAALNYLVNTLPRNYQNTLSAKATVEGYSPEAMLMQMMYYNTDRTLSADYDQTASKEAGFGGGSGSSGSDPLTQGTLPDEISRGHLTQTTAYISPRAARSSETGMMAIAAWNGGPPTDNKKQMLYRNNLEVLLPQIWGIAGANLEDLTFGNQVVGNQERKALVWDGTSNITRVALPKKMGPNGEVVPDFDLLEKYNEQMVYIKDHPGMSQLEIKERLSNISDDVEYQNGNLIIKPEKMGIFLTIAAYASRDLIKINKESEKYLERLDRTEGRALKEDYNKLVQYGKLDANKKTVKIHNVQSAKNNDFYYGNVYIPITDPIQGFMMSNEQYYPKDTFTKVAEKEQLGNLVQSTTANDQWIYNYGQ